MRRSWENLDYTKPEIAVHRSVLLNEVIKIFNPQPGQVYIDATVNGGGHAWAIAEKVGQSGLVLGIDRDCELIRELKANSEKSNIVNLELICDNYVNIQSVAREHHLDAVSGILFDCGFSSYHVEASRRGFSFLRDEPLDMRYDAKSHGLTAEKIINQWPGAAIEDILREYGEERYASGITRGILRARARQKISSTRELVEIVSRSVPLGALRVRIHPATRTFQALRIAVNDELSNLRKGLEGACTVLAPSGRIAVISFHSLEDRIVKTFFREMHARGITRVLTPKPIRPSRKEILQNPRARSAKLRAIEKK